MNLIANSLNIPVGRSMSEKKCASRTIGTSVWSLFGSITTFEVDRGWKNLVVSVRSDSAGDAMSVGVFVFRVAIIRTEMWMSACGDMLVKLDK
jgi:hypothetical protein